MKKLLIFSISLWGLFSVATKAQTQQDTIFCSITAAITIDGAATEECWNNATWHPIDIVWMPWHASMAPGDFEGKFKVAWDSQYLYLLVQVIDDSLSDDHVNPTDSWWDDDCLEAFIDEDRSKGNHERNCNAFAYHMSTKYDAIDLDGNGNGINYKNHVSIVLDTIADDTYLWEIAIKIYDNTYNNSNPEASRVTLVPEKIMGFTLAYCDNDETESRENFIGSMAMTQATANDNYKTADYFGTLKLVDPNYVSSIQSTTNENSVEVFPNPSSDLVIVKAKEEVSYSLFTISGQLVLENTIKSAEHTINISSLPKGAYNLCITGTKTTYNQKLLVE
jgi:hypothetical protein